MTGTITEISVEEFHKRYPDGGFNLKGYPQHPDMLRVISKDFVTYITVNGEKSYSLTVKEHEMRFWSVHALTGTIDYPPLELRNELFGDVLMEELL